MMKRTFRNLNLVSLFLGVLASGTLVNCGNEEVDSLQQEVTETKAVQIKQTDVDTFLNTVKLKNCTMVIAAGTGTFTPSSELSQALYGDPNGSAHKITFAVPPVDTSVATLDITNLTADFASTTIALSGANATLKLAFHGLLHVTMKTPILGKLPAADITINPSSVSIALSYNSTTERVVVSSVTSTISHTTKNCGGTGWCNGLVDALLNANLATWINAPLRDALTKSFDNDGTTQYFDNLLVALYNTKDPKTPAWTMVPHSLTLASGAFNFKVQR